MQIVEVELDPSEVVIAEAGAMVQDMSNELGELGWELVALFPSLMSGGAAAKLLATYKRQLR